MMDDTSRIKLTLQKSGRLTEKSTSLLSRCGLDFEWSKDKLFSRCENFPMDMLMVRDDDIPEYVCDGVTQLGIVGLNVLREKVLTRPKNKPNGVKILKELGFGHCRLSIAIPKERVYDDASSLSGLRIATSYPGLLQEFLDKNNVQAEIIEMSGSVEIAPTMNLADCICDLVSTGRTLMSNGLREVQLIMRSQSILVQTGQAMSEVQQELVDRLVRRVEGVMKAGQSKYIMMNAPESAVASIRDVIPGMENPTVMPLDGSGGRVAIHAVSPEPVFWETMERLKDLGASSILVVPIEKIID